jgi:hypothetical protein
MEKREGAKKPTQGTAACCMSAVQPAGGLVVWLAVNGQHPCGTSRISRRRQRGIYQARSVVAGKEAGMLKQDLSERVPRPSSQAPQPTRGTRQ